MGFPPEAFLIGAQKAGTTTLAFMLDQHPGITVSTPKETDFFTANWRRGLDWYRDRFPGPKDSIFLDASPSYAAGPVDDGPGAQPDADPRRHAPERIHALNPKAKFIYSLRDPVTRTYSSYWHRVRVGEETRAFREAILTDSFYLRTSDYSAQVQRYLAYFSLESFLFLVFEEMIDDPAKSAQRCFEFLGAAPVDFPVRLDSARNRSYTYNFAGQLMAMALPSRKALKGLNHVARAILPKAFHSAAVRLLTRDIPAMRDEDRAFLVDCFSDRNIKLRRLTGISTDRWQT